DTCLKGFLVRWFEDRYTAHSILRSYARTIVPAAVEMTSRAYAGAGTRKAPPNEPAHSPPGTPSHGCRGLCLHADRIRGGSVQPVQGTCPVGRSRTLGRRVGIGCRQRGDKGSAGSDPIPGGGAGAVDSWRSLPGAKNHHRSG